MDVAERNALVVGGGACAAAKVRLLRQARANVTVVGPVVGPEIRDGAAAGEIVWHARAFEAADVADAVLVYAATGLPAVDDAVALAARDAGVPVNVVDRPEQSQFITPSIVARDDVVVGISTTGASPVLARRIRAGIEAQLPARIGALARFAKKFRDQVAASLPSRSRRAFWEAFFDGPIAARVLAGEDPQADADMRMWIASPHRPPEGRVSLVGAGPGNLDLLTLRACRALQDADVVIHDRLVGGDIVEIARRDARIIDVGKTPGRHKQSQDEINALMVHHAHQGRHVVRLKGGDPFVFGRGGEETEYLARHGVAFEIVPGVTAATAAAAAANIPLTMRGVTGAVTFVTGHGADGQATPDWAALAASGQTLAIYMGVTQAPVIAEQLIEAGMAPSLPVAVIEKASLPGERVITITLGAFVALMRAEGVTGPAIILIGEVAAAHIHAVAEDALQMEAN
jgi:uroporphyrin-III C-methyltransferase/precorrin-2 dehydrogenase/sirohydrochlorin ferrochelatase